MKYKNISVSALLTLPDLNEVYMLKRISGDMTLDQLRSEAAVYVVPLSAQEMAAGETEEPQATVWASEPIEEPARKPKIDHDEVIRLAQEGYPPKEIAERLGCSEQSVRNHIARG